MVEMDYNVEISRRTPEEIGLDRLSLDLGFTISRGVIQYLGAKGCRPATKAELTMFGKLLLEEIENARMEQEI